jgi:hypothetical protein
MDQKTCKKCGHNKKTTEFYSAPANRDGLCGSCKACMRQSCKDNYEQRKTLYGSSMTPKTKKYFKERYRMNKDAIKQQSTAWRYNNPERVMLNLARLRAAKQCIPFDLSLEDIKIPEVCPVLGIPLFNSGRFQNNTPSLDKLVPEKGYVRGNVNVISWRANKLKSDASVSEMRELLSWMEFQQSKSLDEDCVKSSVGKEGS